MKFLGFTFGRTKTEPTPSAPVEKAISSQLSPVYGGGGWRNGWMRILEPWTGAWQTNTEEKRGDLLTYPTLYACIYRISSDIGKLPFTLRELLASGVTRIVENPAYSPVLRKPNGYQTAGQFREYWSLTKLTNGNAYILKRRDQRGVVVDLYVLDPCRVMPMVSDSGEVWYQLQTDPLNTLPKDYPAANLIVPASEIMHDRCMTIHHPLIGVPPLAAAYWPALKNMKILRSATEFFANNAQPGGILTAPAGMSEEDAAKVQAYWTSNFTGSNAGRVAIIGADMKFTPFAMKSIDAQMIEQMRYGDEQICQPFGIKPYKVGIGTPPSGWKPYDINAEYYGDALQPHIEHMEALLDEGLKVAKPLGVDLDLSPLLRMDEVALADIHTKLVQGMIETPGEGRLRFNLGPTGGSDTLWGQQQDYPLGMLANRMEWDQSMQPAPEPAPEEPDEEEEALLEEARSIVATQKAIEAMRKAAQPEAKNV